MRGRLRQGYDSVRNFIVDWIATHPESVAGRIVARRFGRPRPGDSRDIAVVGDAQTRLLITPRNHAGQASQWARAISRFGDDTQARVLAVTSPFDFPSDAAVAQRVFLNSSSWQRSQLEATRTFSHLLIESMTPPFGRLGGRDMNAQLALLGSGVDTAFVCHGTDVRRVSGIAGSGVDEHELSERIAARNRAYLNSTARPVFVSTPDLLRDVPQAAWLPVVVDLEYWNQDTSESVRDIDSTLLAVLHAPSSARVKGTALIEPTVVKLHEAGVVKYLPARGVPHAEMADLMRQADVVLDQFILGSYGVAATEAMAAGRVVVGHITSDVRKTVASTTGLPLPIVEATPDTLELVLRALAHDPERRAALAAEGRTFARTVHDGRRSASILIDHWISRRSGAH